MKQKRFIAAGFIGNMLEWYDFALYGLLASLMGRLFFPQESIYLGTLSAFAVFAVGYIMRPIGGIIAGHFGDQYSRKSTLIFTILTMGISTALIGCIPSYQEIGVAAPIILVVLRLIQGLAVGGESSGCIVVVFENTQKYPAFFIMLVTSGAIIGFFTAALFVYCLKNLTGQNFAQWTWRYLFWFSLLLAMVGLLLRLLAFNDVIDAQSCRRTIPLLNLFKFHKARFLTGIATIILTPCYAAFFSVFLNTFLTQTLHFNSNQALIINLIAAITMFFTLIAASLLADILRCYRGFLILGTVICCILTLPLFYLIQAGFVWSIIALITLLFSYALVCGGAMMHTLASLYPTSIRYTGVALTYSLLMGIGVGLLPLLFALLTRHFSPTSISWVFYGGLVIFMIGLIIGKGANQQ